VEEWVIEIGGTTEESVLIILTYGKVEHARYNPLTSAEVFPASTIDLAYLRMSRGREDMAVCYHV
jgi:hypothetical protein